MTQPTLESLRQDYTNLWQTMTVKPEHVAAIDLIAHRILANKARYQVVSKAISVPWPMIGCIHERESGLRFDRHLHNGDPLSARTVHVPAGRPTTGSPPFTWEESAIDALTMRGLNRIFAWPIERVLYELEAYNGEGYELYHPTCKTPYLWSFTNHYVAGKYDSDGHWNATLVDQQAGCAPLYQRLMQLDFSTSDLSETSILATLKTMPPTKITVDPPKTDWISSLLGIIASFFKK